MRHPTLKNVTLALLGLCLAGSAMTAVAAPASHALASYYQYEGRTDYYNGRLLVASDLNTDQNYMRPLQRLLPDAPLPLIDLFALIGIVNVTLFFDDSTAGDGDAPLDPLAPAAGDFILVDADDAFRGDVYLPQRGRVFNLAGTVGVPAPSAVLLPAGLLALLLLRRRQPLLWRA